MSLKIRGIRKALLRFYQAEARPLPWRKTRDPYAIWVSEIMLQQTQVKTVILRYQLFLEQYPSVQALAAAKEDQLCEAFAGLGYYHRAKNLHRAACEIEKIWKGRLPSTYEGLRTLPGIGEYTAAAIASIAFNEKVPAVDGNLLRVLARVFTLPGARNEKKLVQAAKEKAHELVQSPNPGDVNQSLMDLGASVCTPTHPGCTHCPLRRFCQAYEKGNPENFPQIPSKSSRQPLPMVFAWVTQGKGILLEKRPVTGLWPGLWELPSETGRGAHKRLEQRLGIKLNRPRAKINHTLSHREISALVCPEQLEDPLRRYRPLAHQAFTSLPLEKPLSTLARKAILAMSAVGKS